MKKIMNFLGSLFFITLLLLSAKSFALCSNVAYLNLRAGPSTTEKITWYVYRYFPFEKKMEKNGWYLVEDFEGDLHWTLGKLVTDDFKCGVTTKEKTVVKTSAGDDAKDVSWSPVQKYFSVKIIKEENGWIFFQEVDGD